MWGQRFFPVAPSRPTPVAADRNFLSLAEITKVLTGRTQRAVQGTLARGAEVLILDLGAVG